MFKFYEVGGRVRDELLGVQSKDIDYVAVPESELLGLNTEVEHLFDVLYRYLIDEGFEVFLVTPECFTIRAKFPKNHRHSGVADFVMARKEIGYVPGTRKPIIRAGTLYDDLERRDFTVNAMAKDDDGLLIDHFNGLEDLKNMTLRTPLDCVITFDDDPLRILRAIRFSITKGFVFTGDMWQTIRDYDYESKMRVVSAERIREELLKCFRHDTIATLRKLEMFSKLKDYVFVNNILWLKPTLEKR